MATTIALKKTMNFSRIKNTSLFSDKILLAFFKKIEEKISTRTKFRGILIAIGAEMSLIKLVKNGGRYGNFQ